MLYALEREPDKHASFVLSPHAQEMRASELKLGGRTFPMQGKSVEGDRVRSFITGRPWNSAEGIRGEKGCVRSLPNCGQSTVMF